MLERNNDQFRNPRVYLLSRVRLIQQFHPLIPWMSRMAWYHFMISKEMHRINWGIITQRNTMPNTRNPMRTKFCRWMEWMRYVDLNFPFDFESKTINIWFKVTREERARSAFSMFRIIQTW